MTGICADPLPHRQRQSEPAECPPPRQCFACRTCRPRSIVTLAPYYSWAENRSVKQVFQFTLGLVIPVWSPKANAGPDDEMEGTFNAQRL